MSETTYLCRVDHAEHELGVGWHAMLTTNEPRGGHSFGGFNILVPYDHRLFGDATAYFAEGKRVYLTVNENGRYDDRKDDLKLIERIEPCRERMYPENWPEPPGTVH